PVASAVREAVLRRPPTQWLAMPAPSQAGRLQARPCACARSFCLSGRKRCANSARRLAPCLWPATLAAGDPSTLRCLRKLPKSPIDSRQYVRQKDGLAGCGAQKVRSGAAGRRIRNTFRVGIGMNRANRICCITLVVGVAGAMPAIGKAASADGPTGQPAAPQVAAEAPLLELEEVLVHGKRLQERIVEAEDEF